jgi:HK97 family phage major capsid protein
MSIDTNQLADALNQVRSSADYQASIADAVKAAMGEKAPAEKPQMANPKAHVVEERERFDKDYAYRNFVKAIRAQANRNDDEYRQATADLKTKGHYETHLTRSGFTSLTDTDGGLFVPEIILQDIRQQLPDYGVADRLGTKLNVALGLTRAPKFTSLITFTATGEGNSASAKKASLGYVSLNPKKWTSIIPWTREIDVLAGAALMPALNQQLVNALARAKDEALFNGDGSSAYNGIVGLSDASRTSVGVKTATDGSFAEIEFPEYNEVTGLVDSTALANASWVFNPLSRYLLRGLRDSENRPLYDLGDMPGDPASFDGFPLHYSAALTAPATGDQLSTPVAYFGDFRNIMVGDYQGISMSTHDSGTIPDPDGGADLNLLTQDYIALKVNAYFDIQVMFENAFAYIKTGAA